jgi:ABC-type Mn2+/Zn2+ transport system permease subunit
MNRLVKCAAFMFAAWITTSILVPIAFCQTSTPTAQAQKPQVNPPASSEPDVPKVELPSAQAPARGNQLAPANIQSPQNAWSDLAFGLRKNKEGVLAGLLVAGICAYIGVYVVLKRIVFVGASLAQISSAGIALAFLLGQSMPFAASHPLAISLIVTLVGVLIYSQQGLSRKVPQESIIGIGYLIASALTLMFIVRSPRGMDDVKELLDGNIITVQASDLKMMALLFFAVAAVHFLFYKQFLFVSFDREMAATQGFQTRMWELLFYFVLGLTIAMAIQYAGLLSVFAYMVIPAVTGLVVARRMPTAFIIAVASAWVSTFVGFCWALNSDLPTSPPIIGVMAVILAGFWISRRFVREV